MTSDGFNESVFINCPFDEQYAPILQAMIFCITYLGLTPRIATERNNSAENRLEKIKEFVKGSKYSIHDLSRSQASEAGEFYRLNMPFELGLDYGCREFLGNDRQDKSILILEEQRYRYQAALSDLSGCDIEVHDGDPIKAIRKVRNWLVTEASIEAPGAALIGNAYATFQEWHYEKQLAAGFSEDDIQDYPTNELLFSMRNWFEAGQPI